ncbi:MAG: OmpA family protein [Pseudomonadota bacterium]
MNPPHDFDLTVALPGPPAPAADADAAPRNALPNGTRLGEFEIIGLLGEGGFGIVYLAYDSVLARHVAIKEYMPAEFASRTVQAEVRIKAKHHTESFEVGLRSFVNEAQMLARFDHPSLLKVYRFWEANGTAYMVMPYYKGPTLKQALLAREGAPDEAWLRRLLDPLLETLGLLHAQNCFHRDIAPDNILLLDDGRPLLLDFGAARRALSEKTQAFTVILKPAYAPIEQYAETPGMRQGAWTDLFALAAVIHFAIDGRPPPSAAGRAIADPYVPLARRCAGRYSPQFLSAIDRALSFRPADRPQSAAAMCALLGHAAPSGEGPRKKRRRLLLSGIAICILAAAAGGYVMFDQAPQAPAAAPLLQTQEQARVEAASLPAQEAGLGEQGAAQAAAPASTIAPDVAGQAGAQAAATPAVTPAPPPAATVAATVAAAPAPAIARPVAVGDRVSFAAEVLFDFDSHDLNAEGREALDDMLGKLRRVELSAMTVTGHTSSEGPDAYNQRVSERMAEVVAAFVVSRGVAAARVQTEGRGESAPRADNASAAGRAQNRRVTVEAVGVVK